MFGLAGLAMPFVGQMLGGLFGGNQGSHGCHHHHHSHNHGNGQGINQRLAAEDFKDAQQKFSRGDYAGGMEEINEGMSRLAQGPGPVLSERTTQRILAAEDRKDAFQDFSRGQIGSGFEELSEASRRSWF